MVRVGIQGSARTLQLSSVPPVSDGMSGPSAHASGWSWVVRWCQHTCRHAALSAAFRCDSLQVMQLNLSLQQPCDPEDADACKLARLLQSEVQLMEQLSSQHSLSDCSKPLEQLLQPDDSLISPVTEPMAFFHCFMARPIMAEAATMTAQEVAGILQHTVHSLSISLHQLGAAPPWEKANKVQQIEGNWDR